MFWSIWMWEKVYHKRNLCPSKSLLTRKKFTQKVVQIKSHNWWWEETKWNFETTHQSLPSWTLVDLCIFSPYICIKFDAASSNRTLIYLIKSVIVCFLHFLLRNLSLFDRKGFLSWWETKKRWKTRFSLNFDTKSGPIPWFLEKLV